MSAERPLAVVAVGGNALIADPSAVGIDQQAAQAAATCEHIADIVADGWRVVVTHGNGPQVGFILRRSEVAKDSAPGVPLVYAVADTQGAIGFMMQQGMTNALRRRSIDTTAVAVVTRVVVDPADSAFGAPDKPIGAQLEQAEAERLAAEFGWDIAEDSGRGWRRVVASPQPEQIVELASITTLLAAEQVVIACGGGGVPVIQVDDELHTIDAVIDKDLTSALLARNLNADALVILTDVEQAFADWGTPTQRPLGALSPTEAQRLLDDGQFGGGSMAPKIRAALGFAQHRPGGRAIITNAPSVRQALSDHTGTRIVS
ncbi:MAG: carbamate kinase [Acidimicrobiales bacterium]